MRAWLETLWCLLAHLNMHRCPYDADRHAWICRQHCIEWRP